MANCGSTVVKSDGFACLLRRFETHIDTGGVFTRLPEKAYRPGSIIDLPALEPINRSNPFIPTPNGSKLIVKSSSKPMESSVLSSAVNPSKHALTGEMKVNDKGGASSQQTATGDEDASRTNSMDEHEPGKSLASSTSTQLSSFISDPSKDSSSTPQTSESNQPKAIENHGQVQSRSSEDGSASLATASSKNSGSSTNGLDAAERKAAKGREAGSAVATRFIFKQSFGENQNATVYLDDPSSSASSPSTSNKVKQLARSMDNLCSNSSAPTKERNVFLVDRPTRVGKWSDNTPSTAPAAIPSLASDERAAAARAKKPPPVPKKNPKVGRDAEGGRELNFASGGQSDAKPPTGESQTMPNLSQAKKPAARPNTLFPDHHQVAGNDGGGDENNDDDDDSRHKSLPILGSAKDDEQRQQLIPTKAQKNTLYPSRQRARTGILSTETNSTDEQGLPYSPFVTTPMSLGARTPPDVDSLLDNKTNFSDKKYSSEQQSTTAGNAFTRSRSSDQLLSVEATATDEVFDSHEAFDPDSFLSDAFDFLGHSNSAESETKTTSPLKSWTDTWCKASQKRLSKASDRLAEAAGSSREQRPTEGCRKEPTTGNLLDKTKPHDEKTAKTKSVNLLNVGPIKTSPAPLKPSGRDEKTKTGEDAEPPTHFGVVLRRTDAPTSLFRRSSIASLVSKEGPSALKKTNSRHDNFDSRPVTIKKSTESFRTADRPSVNLNRKPSMVSAGTSALPLMTAGVPSSQRPTQKPLLGRNVVSRASSTLNRASVSDSPAAAGAFGASRGARQSTTSANKLESELNDIDRAFTFLNSS